MDEQLQTRYSLLARLRQPGDEQAWREFVTIYEPLVRGLACQRGMQEADASDLCQNVFRAVAGAIDRFEPDPQRGSFRTWLFRIARNLMINFLTRQRGDMRGTGDTSVLHLLHEQAAPENEDSVLFDLEYKREMFVWACQSIQPEFSTTTWKAFWMTAVEDRSPQEAATELKKSVGAIYIARSRVLSRLRERIAQIEELHSD